MTRFTDWGPGVARSIPSLFVVVWLPVPAVGLPNRTRRRLLSQPQLDLIAERQLDKPGFFHGLVELVGCAEREAERGRCRLKWGARWQVGVR